MKDVWGFHTTPLSSALRDGKDCWQIEKGLLAWLAHLSEWLPFFLVRSARMQTLQCGSKTLHSSPSTQSPGADLQVPIPIPVCARCAMSGLDVVFGGASFRGAINRKNFSAHPPILCGSTCTAADSTHA